jgi:hypothetical protein
MFLLLTLLAPTGAVARAQESAQEVTVPFSDPSRPGRLRINHREGSLTVRGTNRKDVLIQVQSSLPAPDAGGLRRVSPPGGLVVEENNNEMVVASGVRERGVDLTIQVPTRTNLNLSSWNGGPIVVENVDGEIEAHNQNQSIRLTDVAGSVVANAHNGTVKVTMSRLTAEKAMAFTAFNGDIDVTLPASTKASLKMRSDKGEIFTDFDIQVRGSGTSSGTRGSDGRIRIDVNRTIEGSVNGGGPEFEFRTFNANIYVRKGAQ